MEQAFKQLSNDVISSAQNLLFTRVDSEKSFRRKFPSEESSYELCFRNIEIEMKEKEHYTDAILISFTSDDENSTSYVDVIMSDVLGTFISDIY